jgi:hypothetical protein
MWANDVVKKNVPAPVTATLLSLLLQLPPLLLPPLLPRPLSPPLVLLLLLLPPKHLLLPLLLLLLLLLPLLRLLPLPPPLPLPLSLLLPLPLPLLLPLLLLLLLLLPYHNRTFGCYCRPATTRKYGTGCCNRRMASRDHLDCRQCTTSTARCGARDSTTRLTRGHLRHQLVRTSTSIQRPVSLSWWHGAPGIFYANCITAPHWAAGSALVSAEHWPAPCCHLTPLPP